MEIPVSRAFKAAPRECKQVSIPLDLHLNSNFSNRLIFTQRFSVGHFWSPHQTITEGIFCKLFISAEKSISYKY